MFAGRLERLPSITGILLRGLAGVIAGHSTCALYASADLVLDTKYLNPREAVITTTGAGVVCLTSNWPE